MPPAGRGHRPYDPEPVSGWHGLTGLDPGRARMPSRPARPATPQGTSPQHLIAAAPVRPPSPLARHAPPARGMAHSSNRCTPPVPAHTVTAADPLPDDLREALRSIHSARTCALTSHFAQSGVRNPAVYAS